MFRDILEFIWGIIKSRVVIMAVIFAALFWSVVARAFELQIVNHDQYVNNYVQKTEKELTINSTRGLIYDRNGNLLAYNELTYSVQITDTLDSSSYKNEQMNEIIYKTISIIEKYGDSIVDDFPIIVNATGGYEYSSTLSENGRLRFLKNIFGTETLDKEDDRKSDTTAYEAMEHLIRKYGIDKSIYNIHQVRKIAMIRYNLSLNTYQKYIATTVATDISEQTMAAIYENASEIPGVVVSEDTVRKYNEGIYYAHIIGYTGKITEDELVSFNASGGKYVATDNVGKLGVEAYFEDVLSGEKGSQRVLVDSLGKVLSVVEETDAIAGNNIYLTIDTNLQKAAYHQLEQKIAGILAAKIVNGNLTQLQKENYYIPVKDVYFQLLNNNVVDIEKFSLDTATDNEKNIYTKFKSRYDEIVNSVKNALYDDKSKPLASLSDEFNEYYTYIYRKLALDSYGLNVILRNSIPSDDQMLKDWLADKTSLRTFLLYCIQNNWIDLKKLNIETAYSDSEVIYNALVEYILGTISGDEVFDKIIYKYMINKGTIKGNAICMTLYDQGVIEQNDAEYKQLKKSAAYAYTFIIARIKDLSITPAQIALEPCSGSVVVTDPDTGDVLAMVSYPSYDNNLFSGTIDYEVWEKLKNDQSNPLFNRVTKTRTAPGSTFKMLTAVAALEEGVITANTRIFAKGIYENENLTNTPRCWIFPGSHGNINVVKALQVSCNSFFYEVGYRLGLNGGRFSHDYGLSRIKKYAEMFGFTEKSGVEVDEYMPLFSTSDTVMSAIGQAAHGYTPVQLARYVSTVANGGYNYALTLLQKVTDMNGNVIAGEETENVEKADINTKTISTVHKGMRDAVANNNVFKNCEVTIAGKTGTAQESLNDPPHALFLGFAPYDKPEVAISVVIPNGYTSSYASELARNVLRYYFGYISLDNILRSGAEMPNTSIIVGD